MSSAIFIIRYLICNHLTMSSAFSIIITLCAITLYVVCHIHYKVLDMQSFLYVIRFSIIITLCAITLYVVCHIHYKVLDIQSSHYVARLFFNYNCMIYNPPCRPPSSLRVYIYFSNTQLMFSISLINLLWCVTLI